MQVLKKSSAGIQALPLDSVLLSRRKIFFSDTITTDSANNLIRQLLLLESEDSDCPIDLYISSPGGEVTSGMLIYDQIRSMDVPIRIYCTGLAASMAAIILAGGQKGRRLILPHSKVMVHEPFLIDGVGGNAANVQRTAESILETRRMLVTLLAQDTGQPVKKIEQELSNERFMGAEEAVSFGICDAVVPRI